MSQIKPIENWTHNELENELRVRLVHHLFEGTLNQFIFLAIDWSIRWGQAEEERRNRKAQKIPKYEPVLDAELSRRAINILIKNGLDTHYRVKNYIRHFDGDKLTALKALEGCGDNTAREILDYYNHGT